ncbi:MAG: transcriptional regulator [Desulfovibrio sp.]|jgi:YHS domain-containing protein|nr:transcriptional regulator [Desulfovibrio sp.]
MLKWLIIAAAVVILYKLITNERGRKDKDDRKRRERRIAAGEMVQDPICNTYVEADSSIKVRDGANTWHFCSYDCRQRFLDKLEAEGRTLPPRSENDDE